MLQSLGWILAHTPERVLHPLAIVLGELIYLLPRRHRTLQSNLSHAFPDRPETERHRIARESSRRLVETGLLSLATPYLSEARIRRMVQAGPGLLHVVNRQQTDPEPLVLGTAHMAYWEIQTCMPLFFPEPFPELAAIFRPVDNPTLDAWIKRTRERFGVRLLSRKSGFQEAIRILRNRGMVAVLFDQNAGLQGALSTLFGRICSTTDLPGLLASKFGSRVYAFYPQRLGFWRIVLHAEPVVTDGTAAGASIALNRWLEEKLTHNDEFCASWLWAHERWKNQDIPSKRLRLEAKRDLLAQDLAARGLAQPLRRTRLWIRLPNWLGDVVMVLPLLRAIRAGRPDAEITLVGKSAFHPLLERWAIADRLEPLPPRGWGYFPHFWSRRRAYPDFYLLFTNSLRGDLEAWLTRCRQRFGLVRPGKRRPLLSHAFPVPSDFDERAHHQLELWTRFLRHFGLLATAQCESEIRTAPSDHLVIGLIPGSENEPRKRWPVAHWCTLIAQLPAEARVFLFGTANDRPITDEIVARSTRPLENLAGRTTLPEYCEHLTACTVLVTNDTGGMHLANALGVPLVALFGPTNPVRTRPVFTASVTILQPPGCPPTGGGDLQDLAPAQVLAALSGFFTSSGKPD